MHRVADIFRLMFRLFPLPIPRLTLYLLWAHPLAQVLSLWLLSKEVMSIYHLLAALFWLFCLVTWILCACFIIFNYFFYLLKQLSIGHFSHFSLQIVSILLFFLYFFHCSLLNWPPISWSTTIMVITTSALLSTCCVSCSTFCILHVISVAKTFIFSDRLNPMKVIHLYLVFRRYWLMLVNYKKIRPDGWNN